MKTSPKVIESLLRLKNLTNEIYDQLHDQEHCWELLEYPKLEKLWDKANRDVWDDLHHKFLKRIFALGGTIEGVSSDVKSAYLAALTNFNAIHEECQKLYDLVEEDDDYVTTKLLMKAQKLVEEWINYFEAKLAQLETIDRSDFMTEQM